MNPEPRPDWFPDEAGLAGHEHFDDAHVAIYDSKSGIDPGEDIDLLKQWGLSEHSVVVDMGAGTGVFARAIAPFCRQVVAVDVSPLMLNQLTAKAQQARLDNISWVSDSFLGYRHPGGSADFVYSRNALHHLPDFWKALALDRVGSMLASGGIFRLRDIVYSFDPSEAPTRLEAWFANASEDRRFGWTREELVTHVREEHSTFAWLLEPMLEQAGFVIAAASYSQDRLFAGYVCRKA